MCNCVLEWKFYWDLPPCFLAVGSLIHARIIEYTYWMGENLDSTVGFVLAHCNWRP